MNKKSIKRLGITLFVIGLAGFVGWKIFNQKTEVRNPIPNYAEAIICLDYVNIRNTLLSNYLFESDNDFSSPFLKEFQKSGLKIPNYIIAFLYSDQDSKGIFASFEIEDTSLFAGYIDSLITNIVYKKDEASKSIYVSDNGRIKFAFDEEKSLLTLVFGANLNQKFVSIVFDDVTNKTNLMNKEDKVLVEFKNNPHHGLVWFANGKRIGRESWLTLNLEGNELLLDGSVFLKEEYRFEEVNEFEVVNFNSQMSLFYAGGKSIFLPYLLEHVDREKFKKLTNFNFNALLYHSNESFGFELMGTKMKADTSISYDFDDNFNKVEKINLIPSVYPLFEARIGKDSRFFDYLVKDSCIKQADKRDVFTPYPFSIVYAFSDSGLRLTTTLATKSQKTKTENSFDFFADFTEMDTVLLDKMGIGNSIFSNKVFDFRIFQKGDSTNVEGRIEFK